MYSMNKRGPGNEPWRTPCFGLTKSEKKVEFYYMIVFILSLLLIVKQKLK